MSAKKLIYAEDLKDALKYGWVNDKFVLRTIDEMPAAGTWISVKDRLPTYAELKDEYVLVLFEDGTICSTAFDECIEGESIFGEWRQNFDPVTLGATDSDWWPLEGVTHWMPLPEPPEEK